MGAHISNQGVNVLIVGDWDDDFIDWVCKAARVVHRDNAPCTVVPNMADLQGLYEAHLMLEARPE